MNICHTNTHNIHETRRKKDNYLQLFTQVQFIEWSHQQLNSAASNERMTGQRATNRNGCRMQQVHSLPWNLSRGNEELNEWPNDSWCHCQDLNWESPKYKSEASGGFNLSRSWQPLLHTLKNKRRPETHGRERPASQPSLRIVIQAKPSQSSNWGAETCAKRKSTSTSLLDIPAFDRKAGLKNRHLISNRGICLR